MAQNSRSSRKNRQLERLGFDKRFFSRIVSSASSKGKVFAKTSHTAVLGAKFLRRQRVLKVCKNDLEALKAFFGAKELRTRFQSAVKAGIIKPESYSLFFPKISVVKNRVLVMKQEAGVSLYSLLFERASASIDFLAKNNISGEEVLIAFKELRRDLRKVFSGFVDFLDIENGNNVILKGKNKQGKLELVLIDQPKPVD